MANAAYGIWRSPGARQTLQATTGGRGLVGSRGEKGPI